MTVPRRILAVDDSDVNLRILNEIFSDEDVVETAATAAECLAKLPTFVPDVVLLDVKLPDMLGTDLCRQIKNDQHLQNYKIILVSGMASEDDVKAGLASGADGYVVKPFFIDALCNEVDRLVPRREAV